MLLATPQLLLEHEQVDYCMTFDALNANEAEIVYKGSCFGDLNQPPPKNGPPCID